MTQIRNLANTLCADCGHEIPDNNRFDRDSENQTGIPQCTCKPWTRAKGGDGCD